MPLRPDGPAGPAGATREPRGARGPERRDGTRRDTCRPPRRGAPAPGLAALLVIAAAGLAAPAAAQTALPLSTVGDVRFEGRKRVPANRIHPVLKTRRPSLLPWADRPPLRFDYLRADTFAIATLYRQSGYLDVEVGWRLDPHRRPNAQTVTFVIREGERSRIRTVELTGVTAYPVDQLRRRLYARPGRPFNPAFVIADTTRISAAYQDRGYIPHVVSDVTRESLLVDVRYDVHEGPLYRFGEVYLSSPGELSVKERLIRRELLIRRGEIYRQPRIERSMERLYETGLFSQVQMTALPDSTNQNIDVDLRVRERKFRWVDAGVGSGTTERLQSSAEWGHRNLGGRGILGAVTGRGALDGDGHFLNAALEVRLVQPWLLATRTRGSVTGYVQRRDDRTDPNWIIRQSAEGVTFGLNRELNRFTRLSLTQDNQWVQQAVTIQTRDLPDSVRAALAAETPPRYTTHRLALTADRDLRDSPFLTTRGSSQVVSVEVAGGPLRGTSSFRKGQLYSTWYTPLSSGAVVAARIRAGMIRPFGPRPTFTPGAAIDGEVARVPTEHRFRLGGVGSIRGYSENSIPPGGGLALLLASVELRVPLAGPFGLELFVDAGNVWARPEYIKPDHFSLRINHQEMDDGDVRYVFGLGPRFDLPFGPLRLDFTWSLRPDGNGRTLVAERQFAIGPSF